MINTNVIYEHVRQFSSNVSNVTFMIDINEIVLLYKNQYKVDIIYNEIKFRL